FYANGTCAGTGSSAGTVALDANGIADPSQSRGPLGAGAYSFRAHYGGDGNYASGDSPCEPLTVQQGAPSVATEIRDAGNNAVTAVPLGTTVHDRAVVSGATGFTPTGSVDFTFYANGTCTGSGSSAGTVTLAGGVADPS